MATDDRDKQLVQKAQTVLARRKSKQPLQMTATQLFELGEDLARYTRFDYARRMAAVALEVDPNHQPTTVLQQQALWTSKNPDQPSDAKHEEALLLLDEITPKLAATDDPETLGIAGGIWKRRWMVDGRHESLATSLSYYERGAAQGVARDKGYTTINAAFVHDLLASLEPSRSQDRLAKAQAHRMRVLEELPKLVARKPELAAKRWIHETLAEAAFGLRRFDEAKQHLQKVNWSDEDAVQPWEFETTARQFAWLARLIDPQAKTAEQRASSAAWQTLLASFGQQLTDGMASMFSGKLGLALSGGGFRASFFHIGVLMQLAERDMLRHVEVLSCVSGGSILGAHYYLLVRELLQRVPQSELQRKHYTDLVEKLAEQFLDGVQKNIRTRVILCPIATLKMMWKRGYTRTTRLGELYEKHLYSKVADDKKRKLRELLVRPADAPDFRMHDNWKRSHKVPVLIMNATAVNTGHNWQFTASWMGEPPASLDTDVDGNYRLRRLYYDQAPTRELQDISIGMGAAASSCVPGLFAPIELHGLYPDVVVRLVDGGVHDNQGVFGLFDQDCSVMVVSDASGQLGAQDEPSDSGIKVLLRSSSISMSRVRTAQYRELASRRDSGRLKEFLFLHMKEELRAEDKDWIKCQTPKEETEARLDTTYDILADNQRKIADIRTDLDSFTDAEAFALIASGYKIARSKFDQAIVGFETDKSPYTWQFVEDIAAELAKPSPALSEKLKTASKGAFKVFSQVKPLKYGALALGALLGLGLLWLAWQWRAESLLSLQGLVSLLVFWIAVPMLGLATISKIIEWKKTLRQMVTGVLFSIGGTMVAGFHILTFDRWFLKLGQRRKR